MLCALPCLLPAPAAAQAGAACRLALLLALDVSSSVDPTEDRLQRNGLAAALIAPEVQQAFLEGDLPVALAAYEWSGRYKQAMLLDWQMIRGAGDLVAASRRIADSRRGEDEFPTAMGYALGYGAGVLRRAPPCLFQTLDVSGDGENNEGFPPATAYREFPFAGVTVNGLVINGGDYEGEVSLIDFYREEVIRGPGAFVEVAQGFADYERAMRRKLLRELTPRAVGALEPSAEQARERPGEQTARAFPG
ncbi:DUF1194 domain-containing protein [Aquicoccus sp. SCR17]|nr:DUF1194 domain-containing protein [Carideicomes alvinocaridis]